LFCHLAPLLSTSSASHQKSPITEKTVAFAPTMKNITLEQVKIAILAREAPHSNISAKKTRKY
jgi:hypothetical protein